MNFIDTNNCGESFHYFARDETGNLQLYHADNAVCERAEFDIHELLDGRVGGKEGE
jgi:hypothetical protein